MNFEIITEMFIELKGLIESLKTKLDSHQNESATPAPTIPPPDNTEIENRLDMIVSQNMDLREQFRRQQTVILEKLNETPTLPEPKPLPPQKHLHTIEIKSPKIVVALVSLGVLLLASLIGNFYQFSANNRLTDNDIKYRYIKAMGEITPDNLFKLETIFEFEPAKQKQHSLRKMVEEHEQRVEKRARELEQARLKEAQAEQLRQEAESLKQKK
ncbi:hypothetical protein [Bacteroides sp.]|uniref:hypothetical protein n=1 Tax=Bacteroides sp. TaxID=29523 RepID=UPI002FCBAD00